MKFEWDSEKDKINRQKHKVSFLEACYIFSDKHMLSFYDVEHSDDEDRWITMGQSLGGRILVVIHTFKKTKGKECVRIISARKATKHEEKQYYERRG